MCKLFLVLSVTQLCGSDLFHFVRDASFWSVDEEFRDAFIGLIVVPLSRGPTRAITNKSRCCHLVVMLGTLVSLGSRHCRFHTDLSFFFRSPITRYGSASGGLRLSASMCEIDVVVEIGDPSEGQTRAEEGRRVADAHAGRD